MRVLITGAGGMIGSRLAQKIASDGVLAGEPVEEMILTDITSPAPIDASFPVRVLPLDLTDAEACKAVLSPCPDLIFHLAAVVSGAAERDFDLGYQVNVDAFSAFLNALRATGAAPRLVTTSSVAVFGGDLPDLVPDSHALTPQSSYGTQKAICEALLADHTRKGHVDGRTVRLPTITVRPGVPNAAASSFVSGVIREPLKGEEAVLPVSDDVPVWIASPDCAVETLLHAAALPKGALGPGAVVSGRGISVRVHEMIEALSRAADPDVLRHIVRRSDPAVAAIVESWPKTFACDLARDLGFPVDDSMDAIIRAHMAEFHAEG